MFMMGNYTGSEIKGLSRKMHVTSRLGFHRPILPHNFNKSVLAEAPNVIYQAGISAVEELISLANFKALFSTEPMIQADLIREILSHIGNDFFYIDNVDKAGRWGVELYGFQIPKTSQPEQAWYACQNTLRWKLGPTKSNIALALWSYSQIWCLRFSGHAAT